MDNASNLEVHGTLQIEQSTSKGYTWEDTHASSMVGLALASLEGRRRGRDHRSLRLVRQRRRRQTRRRPRPQQSPVMTRIITLAGGHPPVAAGRRKASGSQYPPRVTVLSCIPQST
jgi:hypothetical protein